MTKQTISLSQLRSFIKETISESLSDDDNSPKQDLVQHQDIMYNKSTGRKITTSDKKPVPPKPGVPVVGQPPPQGGVKTEDNHLLFGNEENDEEKDDLSKSDKQSALDSQRLDDKTLDGFIKSFNSRAKMIGHSPEEIKRFIKNHKSMIEKDLSDKSTNPEEYADYLVSSGMNLNKVTGQDWF